MFTISQSPIDEKRGHQVHRANRSPPMKVLHLFKTYLPDSFTGIERVIWEIAEGAAKHGVHSQVLSLSAGQHSNPITIGHHTAHKAKLDLYLASTGLSLSLFEHFRRLLAEVDLVHYHFPWPMMDLLHVTTQLRKPSLVTYHSDVVRQKLLSKLYAPLRQRFLGSVDRIIATSPNYLESSQVLQRYAIRTTVIPIGIGEIAERPSEPQLEAWRERVGSRFFLFVGALRYYKGLPFLLEAARTTGFPVVVAGKGDLADEITRARLPNVTLVGAISDADKEALLSLCTAFVFPSHLRSEAFGVSLLEAARAGKPMISCEIGTGTSFVNVNGETGLTVPPADHSALSKAMETIWKDRPLAAAMGREARRRYERLFTADRMAAAYVAAYRELATEPMRIDAR